MIPQRINKIFNLGKKGFFLSILSGILLAFSFPSFNLWITAWVAFIPLLLAIRGKNKAQSFVSGYISGLVFWSMTVYWLSHVTVPGVLLMVSYLSLYSALFTLFIKLFSRNKNSGVIIIPALWVMLEYLRSHAFTGFGWALLGYSQYQNIYIIQIADLFGAWGVSFLVMVINVCIYNYLISDAKPGLRIRKLLLAASLLIAVLSYGCYKSKAVEPGENKKGIKISVIQGNIPQELKWDVKSRDMIMNRFLGLSREVLPDNPEIIIWPEAAIPVVISEEPWYLGRVRKFADDNKIFMLLGAVDAVGEAYYNEAILLSPGKEDHTVYKKLHLVPFGEYIPLRKYLKFLEPFVPIGDFTAGNEYTVFPSPVKFSVLICFEDNIAEISRNFVRRGSRLLVNITNDAWFNLSSAPYQHMQSSVFRAVENRVYVIRSANTGVSGFIAPTGKILSSVSDAGGNRIFITGYATHEIFTSIDYLSFYTRFGDLFIIFCIMAILYGIIPPKIPKK
jgi:apolipoprotein N-acyltransferase